MYCHGWGRWCSSDEMIEIGHLTACNVCDQWTAQASQIERQKQGSMDDVNNKHGETDEVKYLVRSDAIGGEGENGR